MIAAILLSITTIGTSQPVQAASLQLLDYSKLPLEVVRRIETAKSVVDYDTLFFDGLTEGGKQLRVIQLQQATLPFTGSIAENIRVTTTLSLVRHAENVPKVVKLLVSYGRNAPSVEFYSYEKVPAAVLRRLETNDVDMLALFYGDLSDKTEKNEREQQLEAASLRRPPPNYNVVLEKSLVCH